MKLIELSNGMHAQVDDADFERLSKCTWTAQKRLSGDFHAAHVLGDKYSYMHCEILLPREGFEIDHKDGNGLNNTRENLRYATPQQNQWNRTRTWGKSKYKGVSFHKQTGKWRAYIYTEGHDKHLGLFTSEEAAAEAYNKEAIALRGEFARPNILEKAA